MDLIVQLSQLKKPYFVNNVDVAKIESIHEMKYN